MREIKKKSFILVYKNRLIQRVINYLFPIYFKSKFHAKYFLVLLGDNMIKKRIMKMLLY